VGTAPGEAAARVQGPKDRLLRASPAPGAHVTVGARPGALGWVWIDRVE
jgi:hypothetical protein